MKYKLYGEKMKFAKHKSIGKELKPSLRWLSSIADIKKIVLGRCESCRHRYAPGTLRVQNEKKGGINLKAYGGNGIIDIFVVTNKAKEIIKLIEKKFA